MCALAMHHTQHGHMSTLLRHFLDQVRVSMII